MGLGAILLRSTLLALHHANLTGNYTVLRDLGSPAFRANNSTARLGAIFGPIRDHGIDLVTVAVLRPRLTRPPMITPERRLVIAGTIDTRPVEVRFELQYQLVNGAWLLFGLELGPRD